ncbi:MAG TPA: 2Fe-2S iron-sulfur cluster-binding protein [Holophaga sp.]|nr:2Fe-2S iron-sulfur cluster-binding protein [Holophaga sp.]
MRGSMFKVTFKGKIAAEIDVDRELSLLAAALQGEVPLTHRCGGHARCGRCLVGIEEGAENLSPAGPAESRVLRILKARAGQRLACQAKASGSVCCRTD